MATFKGIIFANRNAFAGKQTAIFNYYKAKTPKLDTSVVKQWSLGIDALDGSNRVLMVVDERINAFPWSPEQVIEINTNNPTWFNQDVTP